tara:strand:- start:648 stop:1568 length:921 start_codon:yes stop_codon:yes gene_type:complete
MRYFLIIFIIVCSHSFAEIVEIEPGIKIKIPENKKYYTTNVSEDFKRNMNTAKFTAAEIKHSLKEVSRSGFSGNEIGYSIVSKKNYENRLRKEDEFEALELELELDSFVINKCSNKKTKKSRRECILRAILEFDDYFEYFYAHIGDNEAQQLKQLNGMSDDELASLSKKEIKRIRKIHTHKINYKYKKRYFKEKGIRNIKITGDGFFYIESISSISYKNGVNYTETSWAIPYNNREFLIKSNCYKEYCENTKERMYEIIKPTFSINPNGIKTYDFQKKQDMLDLIQNVRNGYRIYRIASLLFGVII